MNHGDQIIAKYRLNGFYYEELDVNEELAYKRIAGAVARFAPTVEVELESPESLQRVCSAIQFETPEFFYWNSSGECEVSDGKLKLSYNTTDKNETQLMVHKIREIRRELINELMDENEDIRGFLEKSYNYLCNNVRFATEELIKKKPRVWIYSSVRGALMNKVADSLGLALALRYLCEFAGLESIVMTGIAKSDERAVQTAWNLVKLDGEYYHVDVSSQFFLLKDEELRKRGWDWSEVYPKT